MEEADEWFSLSRTKHPPLCFIDVLMRLSWLPSQSLLYAVLGLQADRCTWMLDAEKTFYSLFYGVDPSHTRTALIVPPCCRHSSTCDSETVCGGDRDRRL